MSDLLGRLKAVRETLTTRQRELDRLEGRRDTLLKSLSDEFGLDSPEAAEKEADRLDAELKELEEDLGSRLTALEKQLSNGRPTTTT